MNSATLLDVLLDAAGTAPEQVVVHVHGDGSERTVTFRGLLEESLRVAGGFRGAGVEPGTCVPLIAERSEDFQPMFWGAVAAGLVPVPLAPDARRVGPVWEHLGRPPVVVDTACEAVTAQLPSDARVLRLETLRECATPLSPVRPSPQDLAFLQFSSGSTGAPKGVELTHAAVVANLAQMAAASALDEHDVVVSWMPYFHDMGLIGTHLAPLAVRAKQVKIGPLSFAKRPRLWFDVAAAHRATVLSAANFALALAIRRIPDEVLAGQDLSAVRLMLVGAEPISPTVWRAFAAKTRPTGLDPRAATPVYGLAEATLAVTFPPPGEVAEPVTLERAAFSRGRAVERAPGGDAVELMDVGVPVPGCSVRITDGSGRPLGDRRIGHIEVSGPQIARGYHGLAASTSETFADGWLRTGDMGFLRDGRLCVSGRHKDVLFLNGRTFHAPDMEGVAGATPGLPAGTVAVVGSTDPVTGGERVVVFVSWPRPPRGAGEVLDRVAGRVRAALGHDDVRVLALPPSAFPRTTSGKVQRQRMRARFEAGAYRPAASSGAPSSSGGSAVAGGPGSTGGAGFAGAADAADAVSGAGAPSGLGRTGVAGDALAPGPSGVGPVPSRGGDEAVAGTSQVAPLSRGEMRALVREVWARVLGLPQGSFGDRDRFTGLGGTSLRAMEVLAGLEQALGVELGPAVMRDDTVGALTDHLLAAVGGPVGPRPSAGGGQPGRRTSAPGGGTAGTGRTDESTPAAAESGHASAEEASTAAGTAVASGDPSATAVVAMACRFPGAHSPEEFWDVLASGRDLVTEVPPGRWDDGFRPAPAEPGTAERRTATPVPVDPGAAYRRTPDPASTEPGPAGPLVVDPVPAGPRTRASGTPAPEEPSGPAGSAAGPGRRWGAFLDDVEGFDAAYFGIGDEEARALDPQARILLELAHEALERAGYAGPRRRGLRVAVFAAAGDSGYREVLADAAPAGRPAPATALTGNLPNLLAARVSHCLDLDGPALVVDTACSSALVALHLARRSLAEGECDIAVVGGVNLHLTSAAHGALEAARALSPTGRSRAFSTAADGFVPGEGGAALVLRRLADAHRDEDEVLALVRGTAVNNDGASLSLMAPNPLRQREVIGRAYEACGVDPSSVTYVEAHGTGTAVGDPIELRSLAHAFPAGPDGRARWLGSVKTNIGHLLNAAALPALVKVVLALGHGRLPASLHHTTPSPAVEGAGFALVTELTAWESSGPRRAGINAFGFGGTNAHAVLEQAPARPAEREGSERPQFGGRGAGGPYLLTLSARGPAGLEAWASRLAGHLRDHPEFTEGEVCRTASSARDEAAHRLAVVADGDLRDRLTRATGPRAERPSAVVAGTVAHRPRTVFAFPGQGALRPGQGGALYATAPVYRDTLDEASALVGAVRGRTLTEWCVDGSADAAEQSATEVAQPLLVAHGVALARQLTVWGIRPDALVGHSVGELAAACFGGSMSLSDAVGFAAERGRLMGGSTAPGAMAAVLGADEEDVAALVAGSPAELAVAAYNGPGRLVLSGTPEAVTRASEKLTGQGASVRPLRVSRAFHSPLMRPVARELTRAARDLDVSAAGIPLMSTLTARWQPPLDPEYLCEHALRPVLFGQAVARLLEEGYDTFVELGSGADLAGPIRAAAARRRADAAYPSAAGATGARPPEERSGAEVLVVAAPGRRDRAGVTRDDGPGGARELMDTVARLWVRGVALDRTALDAGHRRVPLPTYPYDRRRHWPDRAPQAPVNRGLLHRVAWRTAPPPDGATGGPVLVTGSDRAAVGALVEGLADLGLEASAVPGPVRPEAVILLAAAERHDTAAGLERGARRSVSSLREALALLDRTGVRRLVVVTLDAHVTGYGTEQPDPGQAVLGGLALAVPQESPGVVANWVDLGSPDGSGEHLRAIAAETASPQADGAVAWRAGRRLVRTVVPDTVGHADTAATTPHVPTSVGAPEAGPRLSGADPLPADGTFLITGGAGGLGSALARELAARGRPVIVLSGRSPRPPEGLLDELAALGADARYTPADLASADDVERLVSTLPPPDAVFHAAGVVTPGSLRGSEARDVLDVLAPKTLGTVLLAEALRRHGRRPGLCVAFSSVSSVLPGLAGALGAYAAANAFLDSFAAAERRAGRPWLSVNFGPFAQTGLASHPATGFGTGLASRLGTGPAFGPGTGPGTGPASGPGAGSIVAAGGRPLSTGPALAALRSACGTDAAQLVIADLVPGPGREHPGPGTGEASGTASREAGGSTASSPSPRAVPSPAPQLAPAPSHLARLPDVSTSAHGASGSAPVLRELLARSLDMAPAAVDDEAPFLSLGLDSLGAVDLVKRLERRLGRTLPATLFFEYRTVRELAAHLDTDQEAHRAEGPGTRLEPPSQGAPFALTPVQLALCVSSRLHPDVQARGHLRMTVRGPLDTHVLGRALASLTERHSMLRIRVDASLDAPAQRVAAPVPLADWYGERVCAAADLAATESALANLPFDLDSGPPVRAVLLREDADVAHLVLVVHHAAVDGYSLNVLAEELWTIYTALWRGKRPVLPVAPDFAAYATAAAPGSVASDDDLRYWAGRLADRGEPLRLPCDGDPGAPPSGPLVQHHGVLDEEAASGLERLAAEHGVSLFHLLLAAYVRCLARWTGRSDIAVNVARGRREHRFEGVERLVGPLADTLPLLCEAVDGEPLTALADRLRAGWLDSERHAGVSSLDLAGLLPGDGGGPRTASPAGFSFARFPARTAADCPVEVRATAAGTGSAATRLSLLCWADGPVLRLSWNFPLPLFRRETVARLDREYRRELTALCAPDAPQAQSAPRVPDASDIPRTATASAPPVPSPAATEGEPRGLVARLLARFRAAPGATAVDAGDTSLTYAALDDASRLLAERLRARGVRSGDLVGLLTEPGPDTVIGVVGILRAGAGWVPLDAGHPTARLADQLTRTGAATVVCHSATLRTAEALGGVRPVPVDVPDAGAVPDRKAAPAPGPGDEHGDEPEGRAIAYVIFTSGSTGRPKAVPITRLAMENYLDWALSTFGYGAGDRLAQTASPCFDASVRQLLAPLLVGATVVTVPGGLLRDPELLLEYVERARITVWSSVPTLWEQILSAAEDRVRRGAPGPGLPSLRWVHVGGEALPVEHVRRWFDLFGAGSRIANLYGPTEATVNATCHVIRSRPADDVRRLPIGRPVTGTELEVVGPDGTVLAPGEPGELLIGGVCLTPGYLGEPELTARAFTVRDGRRWYRSGDRVRLGPDGELDFLGRVDDQVKIRGNRVEPGEVEAVLRTHPAVAQASVVAREGRLLAFVTARPGCGSPDTRDVRRRLADALPPYMIPSRVTVLDALPLTGTGKVDRRALADRATTPVRGTGTAGPGPAAPHADRTAAAVPDTTATDRWDTAGRTRPATPTERRLAAVWTELLDVREVFREDDFFHLGGDSLLVLQVFARLAEHPGRLPRPTEIYRHRTLGALAAVVDSAAEGAGPAGAGGTVGHGDSGPGTRARASGPSSGTADVADVADVQRPLPGSESGGPGHGGGHATPFPVTPGQRGFLLAEALSPGGGAWLARLKLSGPLDPDAFQSSVDLLVERHGMLRTVFPAGSRPPVQQELPRSLRLPVVFESVADRAEVDERSAAESERRFEPWAWPLLRLRVLTLSPDEHVLLVHAHHLVGDGYSAALLGHELTSVYARLVAGQPVEVSTPRTAFRDHALRSAGADPSDAPGARERSARVCAPYEAPVLRSADNTTGTDGGDAPFLTAGFALDARGTAALRKLAADAGATLYAPLLTAYHQQLTVTTGRADLVVGLAVSGRDRPLPDVHRVFGPFATAVPVRPAVTGNSRAKEAVDDFRAALLRIVAEAEEARTHEDVVPRADDGLPLTSQFFFTFLDFTALDILSPNLPSGSGISLSWEDGDSAFAPPSAATDVFMAVRPDGDGLRVTVRASAAAFSPAALDAFAGSLRDRLVRAADARPAAPRPAARRTMDAALVGYLPAPDHLALAAGLPAGALPRDELRAMLFPGGEPRLLETVETPLGRSGFVCVPLFADELALDGGLVGHTARAVSLSSDLGARCVSLAGMIPSLTSYGFDVLRSVEGPAVVTTGHAATVVSVVRTVHAALDATGRDLADLDTAFVGLGSIGASSLELLLTLAARPPRRLVLCDVPGSRPRLTELARRLRERGLAGEVVTAVSSDGALPDAVYGAGLLVTAVSGNTAVLDADRLRPGTTVVDDSFPHCFDTVRALARMRDRRDVLLLGGGLLHVGTARREVADDLPAAAAAGYLAQPWIEGTLASCRTESLLRAAVPELPPVRGLVTGDVALAYARAVERAGVTAAPLHLLGYTVDRDLAAEVASKR
ncbi:amino acid adenylation domain-containing protein [Streptomyces fructofermentans]|uniref:non-ribosomal peptide synthetase/type I polyketide synthase n=1 Tax=Streptomyces fructofermentans TaxID=152141 RepID=UPI0033C8E57E